MTRLLARHVLLLMMFAAAVPAPALASSFVFPVAATTSTQSIAAVNTNGTLVETVTSGATTSSASATAGSNTANASVNLLTGQLKVDGSSTLGFAPQTVGWEFVTFSGNGAVDFAFNVDGTLRNFNSSGIVATDASVFVFDVTTWTSYFGNTGGLQFVAQNGTGSPFPFLVTSDFDSVGVRGSSAPTCASQFITTCTTNSTGTTIDGDLSLSGTVNVEAGRLYLLQVLLTTYTFNSVGVGPLQASDYSHTATFGFTNLNGLTFESSSGGFLSQSPAAVPEPGTIVLLGLGIGAAAVSARRGVRRR